MSIFSSDESQTITVITLMRLYDVGMALLAVQNKELAQKIWLAHQSGKVLGPLAAFDMLEELEDESDEGNA